MRVGTEGQTLIVEVEDDGVGFNPTGTIGFGLTGLRDRLEAVGGVLTIWSRSGEGARLSTTLPARSRQGVSVAGLRLTPDEDDA